MEENVYVSVVMSTFNTNKDYLTKSIESIIKQTFKEFEFLIVCDGSIEEYNFLLSKYDDKRIKLIFHDKNKGLPFSLNEAISLSSGKYIARMDSDDIAFNNRIELQYSYMESHSNIDICGMDAKLFGNVIGCNTQLFRRPEEIEIEMLYIPVLIHPTVMFKKEIFNKGLKYNIDFLCSQDYELWSRAVKNNNITVIPKYGIYYRIHDSQAGIKKRQTQIENTLKVFKNNSIKCNNFENYATYLSILHGLISLDTNNIDGLKQFIEYICNYGKFNKKIAKNVLYNRFLHLIIKNKMWFFLFKNGNFKYVFRFVNLKDLIYITSCKIKKYI